MAPCTALEGRGTGGGLAGVVGATAMGGEEVGGEEGEVFGKERGGCSGWMVQ